MELEAAGTADSVLKVRRKEQSRAPAGNTRRKTCTGVLISP